MTNGFFFFSSNSSSSHRWNKFSTYAFSNSISNFPKQKIKKKEETKEKIAEFGGTKAVV